MVVSHGLLAAMIEMKKMIEQMFLQKSNFTAAMLNAQAQRYIPLSLRSICLLIKMPCSRLHLVLEKGLLSNQCTGSRV
jgi:hypothetical protein